MIGTIAGALALISAIMLLIMAVVWFVEDLHEARLIKQLHRSRIAYLEEENQGLKVVIDAYRGGKN